MIIYLGTAYVRRIMLYVVLINNYLLIRPYDGAVTADNVIVSTWVR